MGKALLNGLSAGFSTFATFVPKLLGFLIILLIGWLIAKGLAKLVGLVLSKIGLSKVLRKAGLDRLTDRVNFDVGGLIVKLVYYFILLIVLQYAFSAFGPNPVADLLNKIISFLPKIIVAIILVIIAAAIARVVKDLLLTVLNGRPFGPTLAAITHVVIIALGVIAATSQMGIATIVTGPVLIAVLATAGGILVVGVGGGLIRPAQLRWERGLQNLDRQVALSPADTSQPTVTSDQAQPPTQPPTGPLAGPETPPHPVS